MAFDPQLLDKKIFLKPESVIEQIEVCEGNVVIDFGCGAGYWTIPLAKKVGSSGLVIATDQSAESLSVLKRNSEKQGLANIRAHKVPYNANTIPVEEKCDFIIISNILSIIAHTAGLIMATQKNCKQGTKLLIVDWQPNFQFSSKGLKVIEQDIIQAANESGYKFLRIINAGSFHFGLLFEFTGEKYEKKK